MRRGCGGGVCRLLPACALQVALGQDAAGAVTVLYDPEAAQACAAAGVFAPVKLAVGGKTDNIAGNPDLFPYFKVEFLWLP